jgi:hypothetical protein
MKKIFKQIVGVLILPLFLALYFFDRIICVVIPTVNNYDIRIWFKHEEELRNTLIRTVIVSAIIGLTFFIKYLWNILM